MSAREIIAQIEALPQEEKAEVFNYVHEVEASKGNGSKKYANPKLAESSERIFNRYDEMFRKLAK